MIISLYHSYKYHISHVTCLWFGGTVVVQNSGNSTSHKSSVFLNVPVPIHWVNAYANAYVCLRVMERVTTQLPGK